MQKKDKGLNYKERVTSTYAEIYFDDDYCNYGKPGEIKFENDTEKDTEDNEDVWTSPSDLLIGMIDLKPPFTSKITRGKTHEGILAIGDEILEKNRARFLKQLTQIINDNESGWIDILKTEKKLVDSKVKRIYSEIFQQKSKIMQKEISKFYAQSLQKLENCVKAEVQTVLTNVHASIVSDLNFEIKQKLKKERIILENVLKKKYLDEVNKIQLYYKLLLDNELQRNNQLINKAIHERNDALLAFYKQIEAENITGTMYVMCAERKKCKIKQFILENYQTTDVFEKTQKIKERENILLEYKNRHEKFSHINQDWENKMKKVLQLFLKFISFSLKLLPEQTTFLLDLEKMVVLQINEFQKEPQKKSSILVEESDINNLFKFEDPVSKENVCENEPFVIVGNLNPPTPPKYGSNETLATDVDLPYVRVQRQFVYAKCHKYEEIKAFLESQRCKCQDIQSRPQFEIEIKSPTPPPSVSHGTTPPISISSDEHLLVDDIQRLRDCPGRKCQDWVKMHSFPYLNAYLDFTEENFERVKTILGSPVPTAAPPKLIDPVQLVGTELPFSATKERYHTVETQYSSQEDLNITEIPCTCVSGHLEKTTSSPKRMKKTDSDELEKLLHKRKQSLRHLIQNNPNLLKMFTDESFDFIL